MKIKNPSSYVIRAIYDWCNDSGLTPYIAVDLTINPINLPHKLQKEPHAVFNISAEATRNLCITDDFIMFDTRFNGVLFKLDIPIESIEGIFPVEDDYRAAGIRFQPAKLPETSPEPEVESTAKLSLVPKDGETPDIAKSPTEGKKYGHLTVIK